MRSKAQAPADVLKTDSNESGSDTPGDSWNAIYGHDSHHPLLWDLINLRNQLDLCRRGGPDLPKDSLALALFDRATTLGLHTVHRWFALGFFNAAAKAVLDEDADFFREVARLIEERIKGNPVEQRVDLAVHHVFSELKSENKALPTKRQVRERALQWLAWDRALNRLGTNFVFTDVFDRDEYGRPKVRKSLLVAMRKELDLIPVQDWTKIFKRCGLSHLPHDRGGQPAHSKRRYCQLD